MKIDRNLNLVLQVETDDGATLHIHSQPISNEVFERYFFTMGTAWSGIQGGGMATTTGPRIAYLTLKRASESNGDWSGPDGIEAGLIGEIKRLTMVVVLTDRGWQPLPLDIAMAQKKMSDRDYAEVMGILVFFILASSILRAQENKVMRNVLTSYWGGQFVSSNSTEYASSLPTPTPVELTGETVPGSFTIS